MWLSEITVQQHLKEMHQAAQMHRMAVELRQTQRALEPRHWLTRLFALLRRRRQPEVHELTVLPPAAKQSTTPMRRAS